MANEPTLPHEATDKPERKAQQGKSPGNADKAGKRGNGAQRLQQEKKR